MNANGKNSVAGQLSSPADANRRHMPPLRSLLAFEAAARHGSFAQGAEELGVTPSAVSHHIQLLEDFLGVKLFLRHAGRAVLTSAGRTYGQELEHAFNMITDATTLVAPQSQTGHLVIASGPSFAAKWLQPRLADFLAAHPMVKVRLSTLSATEDLDTSRFDVAIAYAQPSTSQRDVEPLLVERLRPLCSPALVEAIGLRAPRDLARATFIHSANALTWHEFVRRIGLGGLRPARELWLDRSSMAIEAAVSGLGVILESEILVEQELRDGRLIAPFDDRTCSVETTSYYLVRPQGFRSSAVNIAFEKWLRDAIAVANIANRPPPSSVSPHF